MLDKRKMAMAIDIRDIKHMKYASAAVNCLSAARDKRDCLQLLLRIAITRFSLVTADIERFN